MKKPIVLRRRKTAKKRDELGRKRCAKGDECRNPDGPWLPESEFYKGGGSDGLNWSCRSCEAAFKKSHHKKDVRGADRRKRRTQGGYICIGGGREWLGGWFSQAEMDEMLRWASWEEGMVFKQMRRGKVVRVARVVGKQNESFKPPKDRQILERVDVEATSNRSP